MLAACGPGEEIDTRFARRWSLWHPRRVEDGARRTPNQSSSLKPESGDLPKLYADHTERVRRHLHHFGVRGHDLDDLVQEVFLVMHAQGERLPKIRPLDAWLREVCRRVAAGERRRAHRRHEVAFGEPPERPDDSPASDTAFEQGEEHERLHRALGQLDERARDLVALHELGNLPLAAVAELVDADRKTVRKRLGAALRQLAALAGAERAPLEAPPRISRPSEPPRSAPGFRVLTTHPSISVGLVGSVVVAIWPAAATVEALELLDVAFAQAITLCSGGFAYLAVVEANTRPPDLPARQKIVAMLEAHSAHIRVYAAALQGGAAWIARPIMTGLSLLARPPFPMQYFNGVPLAARWLAEKYPELSNASALTIIETAEQLRSYAR